MEGNYRLAKMRIEEVNKHAKTMSEKFKELAKMTLNLGENIKLEKMASEERFGISSQLRCFFVLFCLVSL